MPRFAQHKPPALVSLFPPVVIELFRRVSVRRAAFVFFVTAALFLSCLPMLPQPS